MAEQEKLLLGVHHKKGNSKDHSRVAHGEEAEISKLSLDPTGGGGEEEKEHVSARGIVLRDCNSSEGGWRHTRVPVELPRPARYTVPPLHTHTHTPELSP